MTNAADTHLLKRLAALEDIRRLKAEYCRCCDRGYLAEALGALFTEDAVWQSAGRGRHVGRAAIMAFFRTASDAYPWAAHLVTNPIIDLDDDLRSASGQWRMVMPATAAEPDGTSAAIFQISDYAERYRDGGDRWRIASLEVTHRRLTFAQGRWVER